MIEKIKKFIFNKKFRFLYLSYLGFYNWMNDDEYLKRKFKICLGYDLNLEKPQTINEKLQWLKVNERKPEYTMMVDKYEVREYVKNKIGEEYLIPLLGVWDYPGEIDFEKLPNEFVLKCNHNSGKGMCICKDKKNLDIKKVKNGLEKGIKEDYFYSGREWPYKNVAKKIIAEKYMVDPKTKDLRDYKFYCFNGKVKLSMINSDRNSNKPTKGDYFDREFNWLDFTWGFEHAEQKPDKPEKFDEMIQIAEKLSKGIKHVRVDLYLCANNIYFGEMTFFDGSGFDKIEPIEWDYKIGSWLNIDSIE